MTACGPSSSALSNSPAVKRRRRCPLAHTHALPAPLPPRAKRVAGRGRGWGAPLARSWSRRASPQIWSKRRPPTPRSAASPLRSTLPANGREGSCGATVLDLISSIPDRNDQIPKRIYVGHRARQHHRRRRVLLDQRGAVDPVACQQVSAREGRGVDEVLAEIDAALAGVCGGGRRDLAGGDRLV